MRRLRLIAVAAQVYRVMDDAGLHVGNLKWIRGSWKFKAIGYEPDGTVVPGGGPLTDRHNTCFEEADALLLNRVLLSDHPAESNPGSR